ncbi:lipoprotein NlpI [Thalassotalea sp. 1_MG-2023]|uniref:lipoprotein NlpI n=1 Tax=Thalassotalea sp. 1_MG-2023 TaxID=3062680 RepID=UPI0026E39EF6|nr:lipoprotein NlpI [Thalassotalea sp. 1_MG-2023]MDO6427358.1 lipoprotein NlpI [Thalassotalea sp. 1_MG-2023]
MKVLLSSSLVLGLVAILQGCSATSSSSKSYIDQLVIAEPLPVNYKSEVAIARMSDVIHRAEITDEQRAQLFYDRGVIYDSVGLRSLARLDFNRALRLKPDLVEAYNFLGIHYTQMQEYEQAYESFDATLELEPDHQYAYLNRGIALYYGDRASLAVNDLREFYQQSENDPYRLLWLYIGEQRVNAEEALANLKSRAKNISDSSWAKSIVNLYAGNISQSHFIDTVTEDIHSNKQFSERLCEAYFYLGKLNLLKGNKRAAANFYKLALSTNVYEFVEHRYAQLELDLLKSPKIKFPDS